MSAVITNKPKSLINTKTSETKASRMPTWLGSNWIMAAALALVTFGLLSSVLVFHRTTFFTNLDNVDQFYTWYQKLATSWHSGYLPIWNNNVFGGQSFAGELQPGVFYPLNLLWVAIFGSVTGISQTALDYLVATHFFIAAFGCYLLLKQLGAQKWAAFLSGVIFAFSGVVAFRSISQTAIFFGFALLPYSLYFLVKFHNDVLKRLRWLFASGICLGLIILSGHVAPFFFATLALGIFELVYIGRNFTNIKPLLGLVVKSVKNFAVILLSTGIIAAPQIYISMIYLPHTYRIQASGYVGPGEKIDYGDFSKSFNLDIHEFINLVDPVTYQVRDGNNLFIGLAPLAIIILAIGLGAKQFKKTKLWAKHSTYASWLLVFSIVAMIGYATWFAVVLYELPFAYQIRQLGRYSILFHLGLIMVLAASLETVASLKLSKKHKWYIVLTGAFMLINALYLLLLRQHVFSLHHSLQVGLLGLLLLAVGLIELSQLRKIAISGLIVITAAVNTMWFLQPIKSDTKTPAIYNLPAKLVEVLQQTNGKYRVEIQDDVVPVNIGNVYKVQTIGGYAATIYAPYYEFLHKSTFDQAFTRDLLGVQLVIKKQKPITGEEVVYSDETASVYVVKRPTALPKFFTTDTDGSLSRGSYKPLTATTLDYQDHYEKYSVTTPSDVAVIISKIAYPGWVAKVDGKPVDIRTYNLGNKPLFKSIYVPAGTHTVELFYKPYKLF